MDPHPENNKIFAELVGCWHELKAVQAYSLYKEYECTCGWHFRRDRGIDELEIHFRDANTNYATDPWVVLREMERIEKLMGFLIELNLGACGFIYSYLLDETGKLRDAAIEWIKEK